MQCLVLLQFLTCSFCEGTAQWKEQLKKAASYVKDATALLIVAGAGIGVDSGLPDYRGPNGFWRGNIRILTLSEDPCSLPSARIQRTFTGRHVSS